MARPRKEGGAARVRGIRIGDDLWREIQEIAEQLGMSASQFVRQAAQEHVGRVHRYGWKRETP